MRLRTSMLLRQGRKVPRMLYEQRGPVPADDDPIVGLVDTPELAALIVAAVNERGAAAAFPCAPIPPEPAGGGVTLEPREHAYPVGGILSVGSEPVTP